MQLRFSNNWLKEQIEAEPDCLNCECGVFKGQAIPNEIIDFVATLESIGDTKMFLIEAKKDQLELKFVIGCFTYAFEFNKYLHHLGYTTEMTDVPSVQPLTYDEEIQNIKQQLMDDFVETHPYIVK